MLYHFYIKKEDRSGLLAGLPCKPCVTDVWHLLECRDIGEASDQMLKFCDWYQNHWQEYGLKGMRIVETKIFESDEKGRPVMR
jgi:hypothetical protein